MTIKRLLLHHSHLPEYAAVGIDNYYILHFICIEVGSLGSHCSASYTEHPLALAAGHWHGKDDSDAVGEEEELLMMVPPPVQLVNVTGCVWKSLVQLALLSIAGDCSCAGC